jgi:hypothetical protein
MRLCDNCAQGEPYCECGDFKPSTEFSLWDPTTEPPTQEMIDTAPAGFCDVLADVSWLAKADLLDKVVPQESED